MSSTSSNKSLLPVTISPILSDSSETILPASASSSNASLGKKLLFSSANIPNIRYLTISKQNTFIGNLTGTSAGAGVNYNTLVGYKAGNRLYVGA